MKVSLQREERVISGRSNFLFFFRSCSVELNNIVEGEVFPSVFLPPMDYSVGYSYSTFELYIKKTRFKSYWILKVTLYIFLLNYKSSNYITLFIELLTIEIKINCSKSKVKYRNLYCSLKTL